MQRPKSDRIYWFVRPTDGEPDWRVFQCYEDGSATTADLEHEITWESDADVWQRAWEWTVDDGFVLFSDAVAGRLVDADAQPPNCLSVVYGNPHLGGEA